jgi:exodeoxyribonuclease VII small subunit
MAKSFESSLAELEKVVKKLEDGDLPLEESLKLFETGVKLVRECKQRLSNAERRIEILIQEADGTLSVEALDDETSDEAAAEDFTDEEDFPDDEEP